jgi:hypothetical protein
VTAVFLPLRGRLVLLREGLAGHDARACKPGDGAGHKWMICTQTTKPSTRPPQAKYSAFGAH